MEAAMSLWYCPLVRLLIVIVLALAACGGDSGGSVDAGACPVGSLGCACTAGGGCDPGLECDAMQMVKSQSLCECLKGERRGRVVASRGRDVEVLAGVSSRAMRSSHEADASRCGPRWVKNGGPHAASAA
jgi:hypothetical protein